MKILAPTLAAYRIARTVQAVAGNAPRPVDAIGVTPRMWGHCVGYEIDDPTATADTQDLVIAISAAPNKVRAQDNTPAKARARLTAELAQAKADREAGKKPGRPVSAERGNQRGKP